MKALQPVIKWFGSKRPVASELSKYFLPATTYYEPFVGGGAMMPFSQAPRGIANDIIPELVNLWLEIKNNPNKVALEYKLRWTQLQANGPDVFYSIREHFNSTRDCYDFLFITRTCVNGMIRYNRNGEFNNGFHLSRPGIDPQRLSTIINQWSHAI
ncbi:MAG: DNA adenine methylase [Bacteroidales bacterium]|nr:DNA adenine methylase [Bacteroidales bacterium]